MNTGWHIGTQDSRLVTKSQHASCADAAPGCVLLAIWQQFTFAPAVNYERTVVAQLVPRNLSSHSSFIVSLHCREHGE